MKDIKYSKNVLKLQLITLALLLCALVASSQNYTGVSIEGTFAPYEGYERTNLDAYSEWLVSHPLKESNQVLYYNGSLKENRSIYAAVFNYEIGDRDLHQCADAAIYLRASYNYSNKFYDRLEFTFTNGVTSSYTEYLLGYNYVEMNGGRDLIKKRGKSRKNNCKNFRKWLSLVWNYAGTYSIEEYDTVSVPIFDMQPGDVFVEGGFPGHAMTVVDMAEDMENGHKIYMLAQSYMPAQEQQIVLNPLTKDVWFSLDDMNYIITPEYTFTPDQLRRFKK
tara:strand:+ start:1022 stop:1855 length:834 start_codon:yes stop_codon:yes gene_type:complete